MSDNDLAALGRALGAGQDIFSAEQARRVGMDDNAIRRLLRAGVIERLRIGSYAKSDPKRSPSQRHWLRVRAELETCAGDESVVASHYSAAVGYGLPIVKADLAVIHLTRTSGAWRRRDGCAYHLPSAGFQRSSRPKMASVAEALLGTGLLAGPEAFVVAADAALHRGLVSEQALRDRLDEVRSPRIAEVRWAARQLDAASESPGESLLRLAIVTAGFDVDSQVWIETGRARYRADFQIRGTRVLVEFDGKAKYADPAAIMAEKEREQHLRDAGYEVIRFTWKDLANPALIRDRISKALARVARRAA